MSDDSQALIREIEEEVRREKLMKLWNQYGTMFLGGLIAVVLLIGGWQWYSAYQKDRVQKAGGQFQEAVELLDGEKKTDGEALLGKIAAEGSPAYATLARMRLAAVKREAGESAKALELYTAVADDASADRLIRSFASLQIASLKIDDGTWTDVQNRLNELAEEASPWRHTARELLGLAAYKHKKWTEAKQAYSSLLGDATAPHALRQRAQIALALITREAPENAPPAAGSPGGAKAGTSSGSTAGTSPASGDLKKDKSAGDGGNSTGGGGETKPTPAPSSGAGATNDAKTKQ